MTFNYSERCEFEIVIDDYLESAAALHCLRPDFVRVRFLHCPLSPIISSAVECLRYQ